MIDRAAVAAAVRALDLAPVAGTPGTGELAHAFALPVEGGVLALLALVDVPDVGTGRVAGRVRIPVPLVVADGGWRLGRTGDGAWRALVHAIAEGRTIPALVDAPVSDEAGARTGPVAAALVCRPGPGLEAAWPNGSASLADAAESGPGEATGATAIVGGRLALRAYVLVEPGLEPDLELTAYLGEEAAIDAVAPVAGWAEVVTRGEGVATVAMLRPHEPAARPLDAVLRERLAELALAPGTASLAWATDVARDLGALVAGLHAALAAPPADAPDFAPREASRDEIHGWRAEGRRALDGAMTRLRALDPGLARRFRDVAPAVAERVARFEALPTAPHVMRIHGRLDLASILATDAGAARVVDFDGPPGPTRDARRRPDAPARDIASMLRSLDAVARAARTEAEQGAGGALGHAAIEPGAWADRARRRFLDAYTDATRRAGRPPALDLDLLDAFEVVAATAHVADAPDAATARLRLEALSALLVEGDRRGSAAAGG